MVFDVATVYTLPEILKQKAPDGSYMNIVDVISGRYPLLEEGVWTQANGDLFHEMVQAAVEPTGVPVRYNEGTPLSASVTKTVQEPIMTLEDRLQIDTRILRDQTDVVGFRMQREAMHFRGMLKTFHKIVFAKGANAAGVPYGYMGSDMKQINGLSARYNALVADSVESAGGSGSTLSSIWIVKWGIDGVQFLYPRTASRTIEVEDMRIQPAYDASGNRFEVVMTKFAFRFGLGIADPRAVKRLANIPLTGAGSFNNDATCEEKLIDLIEALPGGDTNGVVMYAGPKIMAQIRKRINSKSNMYFTEQNVWGRNMITFQDIPIVRVDTLEADESVIS